MRPAGERLAGRPPATAALLAAAGLLCFCALFFSGGFDDTTLVWIGGLAVALAALVTGAGLTGLLPAPRLELPAALLVGSLFGLAVWAGFSTLWSISPDRSWATTNRTLVYASFALLGVVLSVLVPRISALAGVAAALLGLVIGWALLAKCVPALYGDYGRVARLRAPVGYWNELALLCDVAVPAALWLAAPRGRRPLARAAGTLLLFGAVATLLLTYSRFGIALACLAALAWVLVEDDRIESLVALALAGGAGAAAFGIALTLPGITDDLQARAVRAHDGWVFALVLVAGAALVAGCAYGLALLEGRRPLRNDVRRRLERAFALAGIVLAVAGVVAAIVFAGRIWDSFANPVSSQIASNAQRLSSTSSSNRWRWWGEEWQAFTAHPLTGTGAGTFELTDQRLRRSPLVTVEPHNVPLQFLGELGVVGCLLYLAAAAAIVLGVLRTRRRALGSERAAATAVGIGLVAFLVHTVADMDWNYVATCGPLLLAAGVLAGGGARAEEPAPARVRRPLLAAAAVLFALGALYSLGAPWLAQRQLASAAGALDRNDLRSALVHVKRAHTWDPLSTDVLLEWAAYEDADLAAATRLYRKAVTLEPQSSDVWLAVGDFYRGHGEWRAAYEAYSKAWTYDRFGKAGIPCGVLDQARHEVFHVWPAATCPRGRPRAATP